MTEADLIHTPDQRVRVFVSSTLQELAAERQAVRDAVTQLRLAPILFELGARPHPPRQVYRAYLAQSQIFVGVYWQSYGWVAPGELVSGLEDEYRLSAGLPRLIYVKSPAPDREPRLAEMLTRIRDDDRVTYQHFSDPAELQRLVENDLAVLLSERFEMASRDSVAEQAPLAGALPVPVTPLVGRDQEVKAVTDLVLSEGVRLVTLTGPGGIGKTRLAIEAASRLGAGFGDGIRFADLATVGAAGLVPAAVAAALGLSTSGGRVVSDLEAYLRARRLLLVLDNFEHVLPAAPVLAELLGTAPGLVALVTSRTVLRLGGEHEYPVPALSVPAAGARTDAAAARRYTSVRLFTERARAAAPGFELTDGNAAAVAEICRRLDGLPLAIELAAAKVRLLPPQALLDRLGDRMGLLTGGARDLPTRQQALRNTLDWSFGLLSPGEQALFARLGVFADSFGLPAVDAVCGVPAAADPDPAVPAMDTLGSLVDNSLVRTETHGGQPRFRLLDTIREYALDRLRDDGDWTGAHDRHAAYYLALAEPADDELHDPGQLAWLDRLETEHDNLAAAMSWCLDHDRLEPTLHVMWVTWRFWWFHGHDMELSHFAETILAKSESLDPHQRALALAAAGFSLISGGDPARGQTLMEQSQQLFCQVGDHLGAALATVSLGHQLALRHDYARASELLEQSLALLKEADDDELAGYERVQHLLAVAYVYNYLGQVRLSKGDPGAAARLFTQGLTAARRAPDRLPTLISLYDLALSSQARGDLSGAAEHLTEGLSLAAEAGDHTSAAYYLEALAAVASQADNPWRAVCLLAAADALLEAKGSGWLHAFVPRAPHGDDGLAGSRRRLGDAVFEEAWAYGRSLTCRRAVEYVLRGGPPDPSRHRARMPLRGLVSGLRRRGNATITAGRDGTALQEAVGDC
jgi:predicted ATPase